MKVRQEDQDKIIEAFVKAMHDDECGWCNEFIGKATAKLVKILHHIE